MTEIEKDEEAEKQDDHWERWLYAFGRQCMESTCKGFQNQPTKDVTQIQQQRPESPTVTLTWHASKFKVYKLQQRMDKVECFCQNYASVSSINTPLRWIF